MVFVQLQQGEGLFRPGDIDDSIFVVQDGRLDLCIHESVRAKRSQYTCFESVLLKTGLCSAHYRDVPIYDLAYFSFSDSGWVRGCGEACFAWRQCSQSSQHPRCHHCKTHLASFFTHSEMQMFVFWPVFMPTEVLNSVSHLKPGFHRDIQLPTKPSQPELQPQLLFSASLHRLSSPSSRNTQRP